MRNQNGTKQHSPLSALGGLVKTLRPTEALLIKVGEGILIAASRGASTNTVRVRILAATHVDIQFLDEPTVGQMIAAREEPRS